jgi:hypothetical protein
MCDSAPTDGLELNETLAAALLNEAKIKRVTMSLTVIKPDQTTQMLQDKLFCDVLATYTTTLAVNPQEPTMWHKRPRRSTGMC